jgi:hypothetical protein
MNPNTRPVAERPPSLPPLSLVLLTLPARGSPFPAITPNSIQEAES